MSFFGCFFISQYMTVYLSTHSNQRRNTYLLINTNDVCRMALKLLVMYKTVISPLLPPSCRFQPTCSAYAMDAYTEYGVAKGTIMTAWRISRCTPWGGSGYDPAVWPPPGLEWLDSL